MISVKQAERISFSRAVSHPQQGEYKVAYYIQHVIYIVIAEVLEYFVCGMHQSSQRITGVSETSDLSRARFSDQEKNKPVLR